MVVPTTDLPETPMLVLRRRVQGLVASRGSVVAAEYESKRESAKLRKYLASSSNKDLHEMKEYCRTLAVRSERKT